MILIVKVERSPACNTTYPKVAVQRLDQVCASIKACDWLTVLCSETCPNAKSENVRRCSHSNLRKWISFPLNSVRKFVYRFELFGDGLSGETLHRRGTKPRLHTRSIQFRWRIFGTLSHPCRR